MRKVLIVDDNELNLELARDVLELDDFDVKVADNGADGVALAREWVPDLVLMDIRMPGMTGVEAMQIIRADANIGHLPVFALTASVMKGEREALIAQGFDEFLEKPIDPVHFAVEVGRLLEKHQPAG